MFSQAGLGNGEDRIQVHDTRLGEAILMAERDFGGDLPDTGRDGSDRHECPDRICLIPGE